MVKRISIIVCCYNSSSRIEQTLQHAFNLNTGPDIQYEILVVDNNSTDATSQASHEAAKKYNVNEVPFRVIYEPRPGLSYARKCGVKEATFEILLFCDDDNHLDRNYLVNAFEILDTDINIAILGGWCRPKLAINPGSWIIDFYPALATEEYPKPDGDRPWVFGAGMVIKKNIFSDLSEKNILLQLTDRVGKKQTSGGDCELCIMTRFLGYRVFYSQKLVLDHQISQHRLKKMSFIKANFKNVYSILYLFLLESIISIKPIDFSALYWEYSKQQVKNIIYFIPRMVAGRHRFYSLILLYQTVQILLWLILKRKTFYKMGTGILKNLNQS